MAVITWLGGYSGAEVDWNTPENWSPNTVPTASDTVTINAGLDYYPDILDSFTLTGLTINFGGNLYIEPNGDLTVTGAGSNAGTVIMNGGNLTVNGTFTNTGSLEGSGHLTADIANTGGQIWCEIGGTLIVTGAVTGGTLRIGPSTIDNLVIQSTSTVDSVSFDDLAAGVGTLTVDIGATLTDGGLLNVGSNTLVLNGTLIDAAGVTLAGGDIKGSGGVDSATAISGNGAVDIGIIGGSVTASGGTLTLTGLVGTGGQPAVLALNSGATLVLTGNGAVTASTLTFTSGTNSIFEDTATSMVNVSIGTIIGFSGTDRIHLQAFNSGDTISRDTVNHTITIASFDAAFSQTFHFASTVDVASIQLQESGGVDQLVICFMPGTMIRTPKGEAAVETLKRGDLVMTTDGEAKPVCWIGRQTVAAIFADPQRSYPIRVKASALADGVPSRDVLLSPDHALLVDNVLIQAVALVNGASIVRETRVPPVFVYYHVELEDHSLILAENTPAETFVDNVDRLNFDNWAEHEALYPEGKPIVELPIPRAKGRRQVPMQIRAALDARAQIIGAGEVLAVA